MLAVPKESNERKSSKQLATSPELGTNRQLLHFSTPARQLRRTRLQMTGKKKVKTMRTRTFSHKCKSLRWNIKGTNKLKRSKRTRKTDRLKSFSEQFLRQMMMSVSYGFP